MIAETYGRYEISMWVMEFLILVLVGYEVWETVWTRVKGNRLERRYKQRSALILDCIAKGQGLLLSAPSPYSSNDAQRYEESKVWCESVKNWVRETGKLLQGFSPLAMGLFLDNSGIASVDYPNVWHSARNFYSTLHQKLGRLQSILANPERYL